MHVYFKKGSAGIALVFSFNNSPPLSSSLSAEALFWSRKSKKLVGRKFTNYGVYLHGIDQAQIAPKAAADWINAQVWNDLPYADPFIDINKLKPWPDESLGEELDRELFWAALEDDDFLKLIGGTTSIEWLQRHCDTVSHYRTKVKTETLTTDNEPKAI